MNRNVSKFIIPMMLFALLVSVGCHRHNGKHFGKGHVPKATTMLSDSTLGAIGGHIHQLVINAHGGPSSQADKTALASYMLVLANHIKAGGMLSKSMRTQLRQDLRQMSVPINLTSSTTDGIAPRSSGYDRAVAEGQAAKQLHATKSLDRQETQTSTFGIQLIAIVLLVFLGALGVHRYYLGYWGTGFLQLLLTIVGTVLLIAAAGLWAAGTGAIALPLAILGYLAYGILGIWLLFDLIRIIVGRLRPIE